jgi:5-methylcytosine-specific restriction enzyme A
MPARAKRPCHQPGCNQLADDRFCTQHQDKNSDAETRKQYDKVRNADEPHRKLYNTAAWRRTRAAVLSANPLCTVGRVCVKRYGQNIAATVVHHVIPARVWIAQGNDFFDPANLSAACKACHDSITAVEVGFAGRHE